MKKSCCFLGKVSVCVYEGRTRIVVMLNNAKLPGSRCSLELNRSVHA
jgi:hypothetical protein